MLCVGQLVTIYGPTLALKGPKGSMERAVNLMRYYRTIIFWMFAFCLVSFAWMIIMLLFIYLPDNLVGLLVPCLVIISVFFLVTFGFSAKVLSDFNFKTPDLKYVIGRKLDVPGNGRKDDSDSKGKVSALKFLGIDGKVSDEAGKF